MLSWDNAGRIRLGPVLTSVTPEVGEYGASKYRQREGDGFESHDLKFDKVRIKNGEVFEKDR